MEKSKIAKESENEVLELQSFHDKSAKFVDIANPVICIYIHSYMNTLVVEFYLPWRRGHQKCPGDQEVEAVYS